MRTQFLKQVIMYVFCFVGYCYAGPDLTQLKNAFWQATVDMQNGVLAQVERQQACQKALNVIEQLRSVDPLSCCLRKFAGFTFGGVSTDNLQDRAFLPGILKRLETAIVDYQDRCMVAGSLSRDESVQVRVLQQQLTAIRTELVAVRRESGTTRYELDSLRVRYEFLEAASKRLTVVNRDLRRCLEETRQQLKECV